MMTGRQQITAERVGVAIAQTVRAEGLSREWGGLDPQDADRLEAAGLVPGTPDYDAALDLAEAAYLGTLGPE